VIPASPSVPDVAAAPAVATRPAARVQEWTALLLFGAVFLIPFVQPLHRRPQPVFDSEWAAAILVAAAAVALGVQRARTVALNLWLPLWLVAMVAVVAIQQATGMLHYPSQFELACIYALAMGGAYWVGRAMLATVGAERIFVTVGTAILVGALFSVCVQCLQLFNVQGLPEWLFVQIDDAWYRTRPFANLAQANHLATYLVWALLAALYLNRKVLRTPVTLAAMVAVAFGLALTRSRMGALFGAGVVVACWLPWALRPQTARERAGMTAGVVLGYVAGSIAVSALIAFQGIAVDTALGRLHDGDGNVIRLTMWSDAIKVAASHPLLGGGFSQYAIAHYWLAGPPGLSTNYVHNAVLQTAAELGVPLALGLVALGAWWGIAQIGERLRSREAAFAWALVVALAGHGLLEWPLSALHYLIPLALLFALAEPRVAARVSTTGVATRLLVAVGAAGLFLAATMKLEFDEISDVTYRADLERKTAAGVSEEVLRRLLALSGNSMLRIYADSLLVTLRAPTAVEPSAEELARHENILIAGVDERLIARLVILTAKAGQVEASRLHAERLGVFRGAHYEIQKTLILEAIAGLGPEVDPVRRQLALGSTSSATAAAR
jgi:hypothetical protein